MLDTTSCSDNSPFSSPLESPVISPSSSRGPSPTTTPVASPTLSRLKRANSYRKGKKAVGHIDEFLRRRNLLQRDRSQSDTELPHGDGNTKEVKMRRKKKSASTQDFTRVSKGKCQTSPESDSFDKHEGGAPDRKKSLSLIVDFKRLIELSPKPLRSQKKTNPKSAVTSEEEDDEYDGPLFQATTMFVPGYDFKTKQSTVDRPSKGFLTRRGSRDKSLISLLERVQSSPSLIRRSSKDKMDKHTVTDNNKLTKPKSKYTRCDSTPIALSKKDEKLLATRQLYSENNISEYLSVSERGAMIAQKHRNFQERKKPKNTPIDVPDEVIPRGSVKKISNTFEDGSIFEKTITERRKEFAKNKKSRLSGDFDKVSRNRSNSFENSECYRKRSYTCYESYANKNGSESGYASPTESTFSDVSSQFLHPGDWSYKSPNETPNSQQIHHNEELNGQQMHHLLNVPNTQQQHRISDQALNVQKLHHHNEVPDVQIHQYEDNNYNNNTRVLYPAYENKPIINVTSLDEEQYSNSWSHGQWDDGNVGRQRTGRNGNSVKLHEGHLSRSYTDFYTNKNLNLQKSACDNQLTLEDYNNTKIIIPDMQRIISTDLCATEL